jgi:hypothetical protein
MKNNRCIRFLTFLVVANLSCAIGTHGVKKMEKETWPVNPVEINFKDRILSIFPVLLSSSFGMVAGNPDHETLRIGSIQGNKIKENFFPRDAFEVADETGTCIGGDCREMYMSSRRILSVVDWASKKLIIDYWGVGRVLQNIYQKTKLIDEESKKVITVFSPFYNQDYSEILNGSSSLTIDDLKNKKRIKTIPISSESGDFTINDKSDFGRDPIVSFGPSCVIYRESWEYRWLAVNNDLDYIEHPLKDTLNEYKEYFGTDLVSMEISPDRPYAIAIGQKEIGQPHFAAIIQWNKAPAIMPVPLNLQKDEDIDYSSLLLSPSGRWAFFSTSRSRYFLLYIDPDLPGGCLLPFELGVTGFDNKATWITKPEGFVMQAGEKMLYWDLSKFEAQSFDAR